MKRILAIALACLLVFSSFVIATAALGMDELAAYGQKAYDMYKQGTAPTIDGVVDEAEYGAPLDVFTMDTENVSTPHKDGGYYAAGVNPSDAFPTAITCYTTYDSEYLYVAVVVNDPDHYHPKDQQGDFLEFRIMYPKETYTNNTAKENDTAYFRLGLKNDGSYFTKFEKGTATDKKVVRDEVAKTTTYELKITLSSLPGYTANGTKLLCSFGVIFGDSVYSTSSTNYGPSWVAAGVTADIGYFRSYKKLSDAEKRTLGTAFVFNVINFAGDAPVAPAADYTATLSGPATDATVGDKVTYTVNVDKTFASGEVTLSYNELLTPVSGDGIKVNEDGTVTVVVYGDDKTSIDVAFTATAVGTAEVALVEAAFSTKEEAANEDLTDAAIDTTVATVVVTPAEISVILPEIFEGNSAVANGSDYTFTAKDTANYNYALPTATMNGETVAVIDNEDGTYTVANVTGELVITGTRTAKTYDVTINDEAAEDATYGVDYVITLPDDVDVDGATPGTQYTLGSITIGGIEYNGYELVDRTVTIPGTAITGDIVVTINETSVNPNEFTVTVNKDAAVGDLEYEATAIAGVDYTFNFNPKGGFTYTVTATVNGEAVTLTEGQGGAYTIAAADVTGDIVITITAELDLAGVTVGEYLQLDGTKMWIVSIADWNLEEGYRYTYNGEAMYIYNGKVVYLVVADSLTVDDAKALITVEDGAAEVLAATNDVNGTGTVDANDAQIVYNMYNAQYNGFTESVTMAKYIIADVHADGVLNTADAVAIVSSILA